MEYKTNVPPHNTRDQGDTSEFEGESTTSGEKVQHVRANWKKDYEQRRGTAGYERERAKKSTFSDDKVLLDDEEREREESPIKRERDQQAD